MKSNIDDQCGEIFKELKFNKKHRYLIYKVDTEKVVYLDSSRSLKREEREKKIGPTLSNHFPPKNQECVFLISNTPIRMEWTVVNCSSPTGYPTVLLWKLNCCMPLSNKTSELTWMWEASRSSWTVLMM